MLLQPLVLLIAWPSKGLAQRHPERRKRTNLAINEALTCF
jgi:hypothetical protein